MDHTTDFQACFEALTGFPPFSWQIRLLERFARGDIPSRCDIPTGLGKTAVVPIWLIALARAGANGNGATVPRRLVYVVNRRTVVDQATSLVEQMRERLRQPDGKAWAKHGPTLRRLAERLRQLTARGEEPLAISTLRGELADNGEWKIDPARPAVIIGTVDMIGSKLLFSGYGDGRYKRPHHAGLIGQDALIVLDEAHLSPTLGELLRTVEKEQQRCGEPRPIRVMEMSATLRGGAADGVALTLTDNDRAELLVKQRLDAVKRVTLRPIDADGKRADALKAIADAALMHKDAKAAVIVYLRSPETANKVAEAIRKGLSGSADDRVSVLTGTIRGHERDQLTQTDVFKAFKPGRAEGLPHSLYLVATSAGEVGVDLDADHMVCDLTPLESMIQRLGRVNRLGGDCRTATVHVVYEASAAAGGGKEKREDEGKTRKKATKGARQSDDADRLEKTLDALNSLPGRDGARDASPRSLIALLGQADTLGEPKWKDAFSATPQTLPATDILFDAWSLTSIQGDLPGRPEVAAYLHGLTDDLPETFVAWRADVSLLAEAGVGDDELADILDVYPVKPWERLRDTSHRIGDQLKKLAQQERGEGRDRRAVGDLRTIVIDPNGRARLKMIRDAAGMSLAFRTVILPADAGGLSLSGTLDPGSGSASDVADAGGAGARPRCRVLLTRGDDGWRAAAVAPPPDGQTLALPTDAFDDWSPLVDAVSKTTRMMVGESIGLGSDEESGPNRVLLYLVNPRDPDAPAIAAQQNQSLNDHTAAVEAAAKRIGEALGLGEPLREALVLVARFHDRGKDRPVWQRYARNPDSSAPLAKSTRYLHGKALAGYRHEFGSLLDVLHGPDGTAPGADHAGELAAIANHPERDLILHLIASHHGWARPHFEPNAFDHERPTAANEAVAVEVMRRFGRLQHRFGRWGLAWLEALLRAADAMACRDLAVRSQGNGGCP